MKIFPSAIILFFVFAFHSIAAQESSEVPLNNGKKWKADAAMVQHVRSMQTTLQEFPEGKVKSVKELKTSLQSDIQLMVNSCTMKGKAHDALHQWLHPYIEMVKTLEKTENPQSPEVQKLRRQLKEFDNYFE